MTDATVTVRKNSSASNGAAADLKANTDTDILEINSSQASTQEPQGYGHKKYVDEWNPDGLLPPTDEELETLKRVPGHAPYHTYLICLIEFAERGSYYGVSNILTNFIQRKLPEGMYSTF